MVSCEDVCGSYLPTTVASRREAGLGLDAASPVPLQEEVSNIWDY
jgi:hypothetical protein